MATRTLELEGSVNFRDLGGYPTRDGRTVAWRRLFRADGLHKLTPADRAHLAGLGLATVVDLRTRDEAEQRGRFPVDDLPVHYVELPLTDVLPAPEELPEWRQSSYVAGRYAAMVVEGAPALTAAVGVLAGDGALPAVVHCSAGKDRTGVLSALVLAFLGVPDEEIVADYALSAAAMDRLLASLKTEYPDAEEELDRYAPAILHVVPESMEEFLAWLWVRYGSADGVAEALGVAPVLPALRARLLVEG